MIRSNWFRSMNSLFAVQTNCKTRKRIQRSGKSPCNVSAQIEGLEKRQLLSAVAMVHTGNQVRTQITEDLPNGQPASTTLSVNSATYALGTDNIVYQRTSVAWAAISAANVSSISASPNGMLYALQKNGTLSGYSGSGTTWQTIDTYVTKYAVAPTGSSYAGSVLSLTTFGNLDLNGNLQWANTKDFAVGTNGALYLLSTGASGGWLQMQASNSDVMQLIDTNVTKFAVDGSSNVVALEDVGDLIRFAHDLTGRQLLASGVSSFVMDGSGSVVALQANVTTGAPTLIRFATGSTQSQTLPDTDTGASYTNFAEDISGSIVTLDDNGNLWLFTPGSTTAQQMATGIRSFLVDGSGSVVAFQFSSGTSSGLLIRFTPGSVQSQIIEDPSKNSSFTDFAVDASGSVVALDNSGNLWYFTPGSMNSHSMASNVATFLVDSSGYIMAFQTTGTLIHFAPGLPSNPVSIEGTYQQIELDGSGSFVALDTSGNLVRFASGSMSQTSTATMASDVTSFAVDGAGFAVAQVNPEYSHEYNNNSTSNTHMKSMVAVSEIEYLAQFAPGSNQAVDFGYGVTSFEIDKTGAVIALFSSLLGPNLLRFPPGSLQYQQLDTYHVTEFAIDGAGQVVALENGGTLVRFVPGTEPGSFTRTIMFAATNFSTKPVVWGSFVSSFRVDQAGYVISTVENAVANHGNLQPDMNILGYGAPYQLAYFLPGQTKANYYSFNFLGSTVGNDADASDENVSNYWVMADGSMLVTIEADTLGIFHGNDYYLYDVPSGEHAQNINIVNGGLNIQSVSVNTTGTDASITVNKNIIEDQKIADEITQAIQAVVVVGKEILELGAAAVVSVFSAGALTPAVAGVVADAGIGAGAVADTISDVIVGTVANGATQGIDLAVTGNGSFNWSELLTSGLKAFTGSDLVGNLSDLGDLVTGEDDSVAALDATVNQAVDSVSSFATNLLKTGNINAALEGGLQGSLSSLTGGVFDALSNSEISSTFLQDTSTFLNEVSGVTADLPFVNDALSFVNQAVGGDWDDSSFASFANSGVSFLEQIGSDNLEDTPLTDTPFGGYVTSLLNQSVAGSVADSSFAQGALSFLEDAVPAQLTDSPLVSDLGSFLNDVGSSEIGNFSNTTFGSGLGSFLQEAVSGDLTTSSLAEGLGDFLQQAVGSNINLDSSPLAQGLGDFLQEAVGSNINLASSPLAQGLGDFLQQAVGSNINLDLSPLAQGLGDFLQQLSQSNLDSLNSSVADELGTFLQEASQAGNSFANSTFGADAGAFLQQASQDGINFLNSNFSQEVSSFLDQAAAAGNNFANSTFGEEAGTFLEDGAAAGSNWASSSFAQDSASFLNQALTVNLTGSVLAQGALNYINNTILNGAVNSTFAQDALPLLDQVVSAGFTGITFAQDVGSLVSQLTSNGLTDATDQLPGVKAANAALLTSLGDACITEGNVSVGISALQFSSQLNNIPGAVSLEQSFQSSIAQKIVTDTNCILYILQNNGSLKRFSTTTDTWLSNLSSTAEAIAQDSSGTLYILQQGGSVLRFSTTTDSWIGNLTSTEGTTTEAMTIDSAGILYLLQANGSLQRFSTVSGSWASNLSSTAEAIAQDSSGTLYILQQGGSVLRFSTATDSWVTNLTRNVSQMSMNSSGLLGIVGSDGKTHAYNTVTGFWS